MLVIIIKNSIQDAFRPVHDLIKCFLSIWAPQFVILCKSVFYIEQGEGLMDITATSAFIASMQSIFFAAKLYYGWNDNETGESTDRTSTTTVLPAGI
jgi:hypothetical protein